MLNVLLGVTVYFVIYTGLEILGMVYPRDPKPVPAGEIEDAVIIYSWREAFALKAGQLRVIYVLLLITTLLHLS